MQGEYIRILEIILSITAVEFMIKTFKPDKLAAIAIYFAGSYLALIETMYLPDETFRTLGNDIHKMYYLARYIQLKTHEYIHREPLD